MRLEVKREDRWETVGEEPIHPLARTATFRVGRWDDTRDVPYRLRQAGGIQTHYYRCTIRRNPTDKNASVR